MTDGPPTAPPDRGALWEAASLPPGRALRVSGLACVAVTVAAGVVAGAFGGVGWALSGLLGGGVVTAVLVGSTAALSATVRRVSPAMALGVAVLLYAGVVIGLYLLVAGSGPSTSGARTLHPVGVSASALAALLAWTVAQVVVHIRADRPRRGAPRPR